MYRKMDKILFPNKFIGGPFVEEIETTREGTEKNVPFFGRKVGGISGSTLKIIALVTMFIDHIGAVVLEPYLSKGFESYSTTGREDLFEFLCQIDMVLRGIGRLAFPIFCFLLVEGFLYTKNRRKYLIRLGIFALISEIPFDIAFNQSILEFSSQNVFFTLFFGLCTIIAVDAFLHLEKLQISESVRMILAAGAVAGGMYLAYFCSTDYNYKGVVAIVVMYFLRQNKTAEMFGGCLTLTYFVLNEAYAFIDVIFVSLYNGKRGLKLKYVFYAFYPCHLLLLHGIGCLMGIY